ncbi:MAG: hypothetical protein KC457_11780 [Myxococcales bacterium]|nr:hypothetical protein [Myxococcales bacterium]
MALLLTGGLVGLSACFIESAVPATFRYECSSTDECGDNEVCANGLCQQPCGGAEDADCPQEAPVCFNGFCSSICPVADDVCPAPQECVSLSEDAESGICAILCSADSDCSNGDICVMGLCAGTCMTDADCGDGESCLANICVPNG